MNKIDLNISQIKTKDIDGSDIDLTSIKLNLKYPTNYFNLQISELCPYSLKAQLALAYKNLYYKDMEFSTNWIIPSNSQFLKRLERKTGSLTLPQLKIQYKQGIKETWLADSTTIMKFLDGIYPANSLFWEEENANGHYYRDILIMEDWIDEAFKRPFLTLLFLNTNNLKKATAKWLKDEKSLIIKARLELLKIKKIAEISSDFPSKQKSLTTAYKRFDDDLLPIVSDRIEENYKKGQAFLFGNEICAADLGLYSFLKVLLQLEESNLISRRAVLLKYIDSIEDLNINDNLGSNSKKNLNRQKVTLIGKDEEND